MRVEVLHGSCRLQQARAFRDGGFPPMSKHWAIHAVTHGWAARPNRRAARRRRLRRQNVAVHSAGGRCRRGSAPPAQAGASNPRILELKFSLNPITL